MIRPFDGQSLWIGRHSADDDVLVFDPVYAVPATGDRYPLYSLRQKRNRVFPVAVIHEKIVGVEGSERERLFEEYGAARSAAEIEAQQRHDREAKQRRTTIERRHRLFLSRLELEYKGLRSPTRTRSRRVDHCYNCKERVDSAIDPECAACGWIVCYCGACGCGYGGTSANDADAEPSWL
jgi:hypothetical protein